MNISISAWARFKDKLSAISTKATEDMVRWVQINGGYANIPRDALITHAYALATKYGEASAALSAEMYDAVATLQGVIVPAAVPAETVSYSEVAKTINGIIKKTGSESILDQAVGLLVKDTGQKTTIQNARRDGAEIAFITNGDTCAFCIMLSSQGWKKASRAELDKDGQPAHLHANCDCTYAVRFNDSLKYDGYDPSEYKKMYYDAPLEEGQRPTMKNRLNAMRRQFYAENKEEINEQKRDAYEKRQERNSSQAEEKMIN